MTKNLEYLILKIVYCNLSRVFLTRALAREIGQPLPTFIDVKKIILSSYVRFQRYAVLDTKRAITPKSAHNSSDKHRRGG